MELIGKNILITGASAGLGRELAKTLAHRGARLILVGRNEPSLQETAASCRKQQAECLVVPLDITDKTAVQMAISNVQQGFGPITGLINNAGCSMWSLLRDLPDIELLHELMQINYFGTVNMTMACLADILSEDGFLCVVSSLQAKLGVPGHTGYAASKFAVEGFMQSLRLEFPKLQVTIAYPGWIVGTELRARAHARLGLDPPAPTQKNWLSVDKKVCSEQLIRAIERGRPRLYLPRFLQGLVALQSLAPKLTGRLISAVVGRQLKRYAR